MEPLVIPQYTINCEPRPPKNYSRKKCRLNKYFTQGSSTMTRAKPVAKVEGVKVRSDRVASDIHSGATYATYSSLGNGTYFVIL